SDLRMASIGLIVLAAAASAGTARTAGSQASPTAPLPVTAMPADLVGWSIDETRAMDHRRFFDNPDFLAYIRLLRDLHGAIREGNDESEEGERIRDQMDGPGSRLSADEVAGAQGISADFYSLTDPPSGPIPARTAEVDDDLEAAGRA